VLVEFVDGMQWVDPGKAGNVIDPALETPETEAAITTLSRRSDVQRGPAAAARRASNPTIITGTRLHD